MNIANISTAFTTTDDKIQDIKDFYVKHFDAEIIFDCGWYVNLRFGKKNNKLQFMTPQQPEHQLANSDGLMYNIEVEDVDTVYKKLTDEGLAATVPLEGHPWGDRGFAVQDPNGISLYIYTEKEPTEEFKQYYK